MSAELHIDDPRRMPGQEAIRAVVESCLALPSQDALLVSDEYLAKHGDPVISFLPHGLDTEEGFRGSSQRCTELLEASLTTNKSIVELVHAARTVPFIGSYAVRDADISSGIWRGVALWAPVTSK